MLPSSVNELILIPQSEFDSVEELITMVRNTNCLDVEEEDYLSDSVYLCNADTLKITMCTITEKRNRSSRKTQNATFRQLKRR